MNLLAQAMWWRSQRDNTGRTANRGWWELDVLECGHPAVRLGRQLPTSTLEMVRKEATGLRTIRTRTVHGFQPVGSPFPVDRDELRWSEFDLRCTLSPNPDDGAGG